ncbi:MAG: phosphoglycerate kinase [Patescibacteria group bacterium]|nr:phosphoglycerate kinase [Patescibacteria group bacterium]
MIIFDKSELLRFNREKIKNKNIIARVDFNVVVDRGKILEKFRIKSIKETLDILRLSKRVVLVSHWGEPIKRDKKYSLKSILPQIEKILNIKINFLDDLRAIPKEKFNLFENLRFWPEEKECDLVFAQKLSSLGEIFIHEAFSSSHRRHTSTYLLPKLLPTFYGLNFEKEINLLNKVLKSKGFILILGGAKISTKLPLIKKFIKKARFIILGGGLANTFLKANGFEMGKSLVEKEMLYEVKKIRSENIFVPFDFIVKGKGYLNINQIGENDVIYDIGRKSLVMIFNLIKKAKTIVWNGPLGYVEKETYSRGTLMLAKYLIKLNKLNNHFIVVGGGDTLAFLEKKKLINKFNNISTGGGAMINYLANEKWER